VLEKATGQRVKQSVVAMFVARPISAVGGLLILVVLSRALSKSDYGLYFGLWAAAEILILASSLGLVQAVQRYVSAVELTDGRLLPRGPVFQLLGWRIVTMLLAAGGAVIAFNFVMSIAGVPSLGMGAALIFGAIVFGEGTARFLEAIFDSMLSQRRSQATLVGRTVFRLFGYLYFLAFDTLSLLTVLYVEVVVVLLAATVGLAFLGRLYMGADQLKKTKSPEEYNYARILRFVLPAFLAELVGLAYGPDVLKIALTKTTGVEAVALFGFAYSLAAVMLRYMPASLFAGVFRPIFVAASTKPDGDALLSDLFNLVVKVNWIVILPIFCVLFSASSVLLSAVTGGKYADVDVVLMILVGGLLPMALHLTLLLYCLARENSVYPLVSTGFAVCGLPLGLALSTWFGAEGMALALGMSEVIWTAACLFFLQRIARDAIRLDWGGFARMTVAAALAISIGFGLDKAGAGWYLVAPVVALSCLLGVYFLSAFSDEEKNRLTSILPFSFGNARVK